MFKCFCFWSPCSHLEDCLSHPFCVYHVPPWESHISQPVDVPGIPLKSWLVYGVDPLVRWPVIKYSKLLKISMIPIKMLKCLKIVVSIGEIHAFCLDFPPLENITTIPPRSTYVIYNCFILFRNWESPRKTSSYFTQRRPG